MTIQSTDRGPWNHVGDPANPPLAYLNKIFAASDLAVYINEVLQDPATYTVTGVGNEQGGTVLLATAPAGGEAISLVSKVPSLQPVGWPEFDAFPAKSHEDAADRVVVLVQQLESVGGRQISYPATEIDPPPGELEPKATRANKPAYFDGNGRLIAQAGGVPPSVPVSGFMEPVLLSGDADQLRGHQGLRSVDVVKFGGLMLPNSKPIQWRNAAGTIDVNLLELNASDEGEFRDALGQIFAKLIPGGAGSDSYWQLWNAPGLIGPLLIPEGVAANIPAVIMAKGMAQVIVASPLQVSGAAEFLDDVTMTGGLVLGGATGGITGPGEVNAKDFKKDGVSLATGGMKADTPQTLGAGASEYVFVKPAGYGTNAFDVLVEGVATTSLGWVVRLGVTASQDTGYSGRFGSSPVDSFGFQGLVDGDTLYQFRRVSGDTWLVSGHSSKLTATEDIRPIMGKVTVAGGPYQRVFVEKTGGFNFSAGTANVLWYADAA